MLDVLSDVLNRIRDDVKADSNQRSILFKFRLLEICDKSSCKRKVFSL